MKTSFELDIDPVPILFAHLSCSDGQLHDKELLSLDNVLAHSKNKKTQIEVEAVLSRKDGLIPLEDILSLVPIDDRSQILDDLIHLGCVDGIKAPEELAFIQTVSSQWGISLGEIESRWNAAKADIEGIDLHSTHLEGPYLVVAGIDTVFGRGFLNHIAETGSITWPECLVRHRQGGLLAGPEYSAAVERCAEVAESDFNCIEPLLNTCIQTLESLLSNLTSKKETDTRNGSRKSEKQVGDAISVAREGLSEEMRPKLESVRSSLFAKYRALRRLTVAFMGKTKAGKSTLHAVVTGGGWNAIGVGSQRTTRYNRVYEWRNIRIIDTPGIGAPEDGGRRDEEIASSIVDEADIICFVVTNDSQQKAEFAFLKKLKNKGKPLLILLNVKSNLDSKARRKRFLENADKVFQMKGKNDLLGHVNRIRRYAREFYGNDYFDIVPVHLHAARLSREERRGDVSTLKLWEASGIQGFLDLLQLSLVKEGPIRRSQTLIGSTVSDIIESIDALREFRNSFSTLRKELEKNSTKGLRDRHRARTNTELDLENDIKKVFSALDTTLQEFAEENWELKEKDLQKCWENHAKRFDFNGRLQNIIKKAYNDYQLKVHHILEEIGKELKMLSRLGISDISLGDLGSSTSHKVLFGIGGSVLGLIGGILLLSNPIGWAFIGIGTVIGVIGSFFKSKAKKRQERTNKICDNIRNSLREQEKDLIKDQKQVFRKKTKEVDAAVSNYFNDLISRIKVIDKHCEYAINELNSVVYKINSAFAFRVIEWMCEEEATHSLEILKVSREPGCELRIKTNKKLQPVFDIEYIRRVLQEDIILEQ